MTSIYKKIMIKNIFITFIICSFTMLSTSCSYFDENRVEALYEKANEGDIEAMYLYAKHIQNTAPDEAFTWLEKAAKLNHVQAMNELADLYFERSSKWHNYNLAFIWVEKLAQRGDKFSQSRLGWLYVNGQGTQQDYVKALNWYQKAAEQGDRYSKFISHRCILPERVAVQIMKKHLSGLKKRQNWVIGNHNLFWHICINTLLVLLLT